jgi:hypothetical protein
MPLLPPPLGNPVLGLPLEPPLMPVLGLLLELPPRTPREPAPTFVEPDGSRLV